MQVRLLGPIEPLSASGAPVVLDRAVEITGATGDPWVQAQADAQRSRVAPTT